MRTSIVSAREQIPDAVLAEAVKQAVRALNVAVIEARAAGLTVMVRNPLTTSVERPSADLYVLPEVFRRF